jgi:hypothetical protein
MAVGAISPGSPSWQAMALVIPSPARLRMASSITIVTPRAPNSAGRRRRARTRPVSSVPDRGETVLVNVHSSPRPTWRATGCTGLPGEGQTLQPAFGDGAAGPEALGRDPSAPPSDPLAGAIRSAAGASAASRTTGFALAAPGASKSLIGRVKVTQDPKRPEPMPTRSQPSLLPRAGRRRPAHAARTQCTKIPNSYHRGHF